MANLTDADVALLPAAVRGALDEAQQLEAAMYGKPDQAPDAAGSPPAEPSTDDTPAGQGQTSAPDTLLVDSILNRPTGDGTPSMNARPAAPEQTDGTVSAPEFQQLRQQFNTLQGKYNAEVPRLQEALREKDGTIQRLEAQLASKPAVPKPPENGHTRESLRDLYGLTDDQIDFGTELYDAIERLVELRVGSQVGRLQEHVSQTEVSRYMAELTRLVNAAPGPTLAELNRDPAFLRWLKATDPRARRTYHELMQDADADMDAPGVAQFFLDYKAGLTGKRSGNGNAVASQVMPTGVATPPAGPPTPGRMYTLAEYSRIMDAVARGFDERGVKLTPESRRKLEQEMDLAVKQRRIRQ